MRSAKSYSGSLANTTHHAPGCLRCRDRGGDVRERHPENLHLRYRPLFSFQRNRSPASQHLKTRPMTAVAPALRLEPRPAADHMRDPAGRHLAPEVVPVALAHPFGDFLDREAVRVRRITQFLDDLKRNDVWGFESSSISCRDSVVFGERFEGNSQGLRQINLASCPIQSLESSSEFRMRPHQSLAYSATGRHSCGLGPKNPAGNSILRCIT